MVYVVVPLLAQSALLLAALENRQLVAGYLAETMSILGVPLSQTYQKGNTIVHYLAKWGDEFAAVLKYLIRVRRLDGSLAFDLDARNHEGRSALQDAVTAYRPASESAHGFSHTAVISLLVKHGADAGLSVSLVIFFQDIHHENEQISSEIVF